MTYKTHREYAVTYAYLAAILVYELGVVQINYYLAMVVLVLISKYAAMFPDVDHNWENVKEKTAVNFIINKLIHVTGGRHRSWQTHSLDVWVVFMVGSVLGVKWLPIDTINKEVGMLIVFGFGAGWLSHLIADMCNHSGIRLFCWNRKLKIRFVPKKLGKMKFNTGEEWEKFVFWVTSVLNVVLGIFALSYPVIIGG